MSIDLREQQIMAVSLHPGWVRTRLGGTKAPLEIDEACTEMCNTILKLNEQHNGTFIDYKGKTLPW